MFKDLNILYAEDEEFIRSNIAETLEFMSISVTAVSNGEEAYKSYLENRPDIIIADIEMPNMNGLEFIEKIRKIDNKTPIIITSAYTNTEYFLKAIELNLVKYIIKPITLVDLKEALTICVNNLQEIDNGKRYFNENSYYDLKTQKLFIDTEEIKLNNHEILFLELLLKYPDQIVKYEQMEAIIWEDGMTKDSIRSLVKDIRRKLPPNTIENIAKLGYKILLDR